MQRATSSYTTNFEAVVIEIFGEIFNLLLGSQLIHNFESNLNCVEAEALGLF
jgi:hypothetical protein